LSPSATVTALRASGEPLILRLVDGDADDDSEEGTL
jgi:hypothetical protein